MCIFIIIGYIRIWNARRWDSDRFFILISYITCLIYSSLLGYFFVFRSLSADIRRLLLFFLIFMVLLARTFAATPIFIYIQNIYRISLILMIRSTYLTIISNFFMNVLMLVIKLNKLPLIYSDRYSKWQCFPKPIPESSQCTHIIRMRIQLFDILLIAYSNNLK